MLSRLRFDRFIGRNHQQHEIETAGAREHVTHEPLVSRHINKTEANVAQLEKCKADIQGNASPLLFLQAVGMRAGQGLNQRGFPMIDMTGCADDDISHSSATALKSLADATEERG